MQKKRHFITKTNKEKTEIPNELTPTSSRCRSVENAEKIESRQVNVSQRQLCRRRELAVEKEVQVEMNRQRKIDEAKEERYRRLQHYYRNARARYEQSLKDLEDRKNAIRMMKKQIALFQNMRNGVDLKLASGRNPSARYPQSSSAPVTNAEKTHPCMWQPDSKLDAVAVQLLGLAFETFMDLDSESKDTMAQTTETNSEEMTSDVETMATDRGHWSRDL